MRCKMDCTGHTSILVLLVSSAVTVSALEGLIEPQDPIVPVGSDLTLICSLTPAATNSNRTANDIIWGLNSGELPHDSYAVLNNTVSTLSLTNVTFGDTGNYHCSFTGDGFFEKKRTFVQVGVKPEPALLQCFVRCPEEYWCEWSEGSPTNLRTKHVFTFFFQGTWMSCPDSLTKGQNTCFIDINHNTATTQSVRVNSTNALGGALAVTSFSPYNDVVVNPPRNVRLAPQAHETSLSVTWILPDEWYRNDPASLDYRLRYKRQDCVQTNLTCCCWMQIDLLTLMNSLSYTLRDLDPYTIYVVQLAARYGMQEKNWSVWSPEKTAITREIAPTSRVQELSYLETDDLIDPVYKRNVNIRWENLPPNTINGELRGYNIIVEEDGQGNDVRHLENSHQDNWRDIQDLKKFTGYQIKVAAINGAGTGPWASVHIDDLTKAPNAPDEVRAVALTTTSIQVEWDEPSQPNGYTQHYKVQWRRANKDTQNYTTPDARQLSYTLEGLEPFVLYEVGVTTINSRGDSGLRSVQGGVRTLEGVPDAAPTDLDVRAVADRSDSLTLSWTRPSVQNINGKLTGYRISFCESSPDSDYETTGTLCSENVHNVTVPDSVMYTLTGLETSTDYSVWIAASTTVGRGPDSEPVHQRTADAPQGIILKAVVLPIAVLTVIILVLVGIWLRYPTILQPFPGPKFIEEDFLKKGCHAISISRSSSRIEQEQFDEIQSTPNDALIELMGEKCEMANEAFQTSQSLEFRSESVDLEPKSLTVRFISSDSRDSGVPPSPGSDIPDFSVLGDKLSFTEDGDDSVFLEDDGGGSTPGRSEKLTVRIDSNKKGGSLPEGNVSPTSPADAVGPYTLVGQLPSSNKCPKPASHFSPVRSPKKVSFGPPSAYQDVPMCSPTSKQPGARVVDGHHQQRPSCSAKKTSSSSPVDVSPYTQMSDLESRQQQQQKQQTSHLPSSTPAATRAPHQCSSPPIVSPYTQVSELATMQHKPPREACQMGNQLTPDNRHLGQGNQSIQAVSPYTQASSESFTPRLRAAPHPRQEPPVGASRSHNQTNASPPCSKSMPSSSYTQLSEMAAMQPRLQGSTNQSTEVPPIGATSRVQASPRPVVSPYTDASEMEAIRPKHPTSASVAQSTTSLPKLNPQTSVSPYTHMSEMQAMQSEKLTPDSMAQETAIPSSKTIPPPAVSPYIQMSGVEAMQPRQSMTDQSVSSSASDVPRLQTTQLVAESSSIQTPALPANQDRHQLPPVSHVEAPRNSPQPVPASPVAPYTQMSEMAALEPRQHRNQQAEVSSAGINRNPGLTPPPAASPYIQMPSSNKPTPYLEASDFTQMSVGRSADREPQQRQPDDQGGPTNLIATPVDETLQAAVRSSSSSPVSGLGDSLSNEQMSHSETSSIDDGFCNESDEDDSMSEALADYVQAGFGVFSPRDTAPDSHHLGADTTGGSYGSSQQPMSDYIQVDALRPGSTDLYPQDQKASPGLNHQMSDSPRLLSDYVQTGATINIHQEARPSSRKNRCISQQHSPDYVLANADGASTRQDTLPQPQARPAASLNNTQALSSLQPVSDYVQAGGGSTGQEVDSRQVPRANSSHGQRQAPPSQQLVSDYVQTGMDTSSQRSPASSQQALRSDHRGDHHPASASASRQPESGYVQAGFPHQEHSVRPSNPRQASRLPSPVQARAAGSQAQQDTPTSHQVQGSDLYRSDRREPAIHQPISGYVQTGSLC